MLTRLGPEACTRVRPLAATPAPPAPAAPATYCGDLVRLRALLIAELSRGFPAQVERLLARAGGPGPIVLRAHPEDLAQLGPHAGEAPVTQIADPALTRGGCVIESETGTLDATVEARVTLLLAAAEVAQ